MIPRKKNTKLSSKELKELSALEDDHTENADRKPEGKPEGREREKRDGRDHRDRDQNRRENRENRENRETEKIGSRGRKKTATAIITIKTRTVSAGTAAAKTAEMVMAMEM